MLTYHAEIRYNILYNNIYSNNYKGEIIMNSIKQITLALGLVTALSVNASAFSSKDVGQTGGNFLSLPVSVRAIGMGEAQAAVPTGSEALYWNPANLAETPNSSVTLFHSLYIADTFYDYASYSKNLGKLGTVATSFQYFNHGEIVRRNSSGKRTGEFTPQDLAYTVGWGKSVKENVLLGVSGKFIRSQIVRAASTFAFDLGATWKVSEKFRLSLNIQNLGPGLEFDKEEETDGLPQHYRLGSYLELNKNWVMALDLNFPRSNDMYVSLGTEVKETYGAVEVLGRMGFNSRATDDLEGFSSVSFGGGLKYKAYGVDFAWTPLGDLGNTYRVGLNIEF